MPGSCDISDSQGREPPRRPERVDRLAIGNARRTLRAKGYYWVYADAGPELQQGTVASLTSAPHDHTNITSGGVPYRRCNVLGSPRRAGERCGTIATARPRHG
jgi:hypothetical protein